LEDWNWQSGIRFPPQQFLIWRINITPMRLYFISMLLFIPALPGIAQEITVFKNGEDGYACFRIPAIVKAPDGELLAFCEARKYNCNDHGEVRIVLKRSSDNGSTWGALQVVAENGNLQTGNSAPVYDLLDPNFRNGRLFLFYNTGSNASEYEVREGKAIREAWYITSTDNGKSWMAPVNITTSVSRPNHPSINPDYHFKEDWRGLANTPGHAFQFSTGKYRGRIFIAANHSAGPPKNDFSDYEAHGYFSDDHGKTWQLTPSVNFPGSNESTAAELSNGGVIMNIRNPTGNSKYRIIAVSHSGGSKWDTVYIDKQLPDPVCQGSMLNFKTKEGKNVILFSNLKDTVSRKNLTLYCSWDDGRTWKVISPICTGSAAYSDLVALPKFEVGVLYEKEGYSRIVFQVMRFN